MQTGVFLAKFSYESEIDPRSAIGEFKLAVLKKQFRYCGAIILLFTNVKNLALHLRLLMLYWNKGSDTMAEYSNQRKIPKRVLTEIHNTIKYIWEYDIPKDYISQLLMKEDTFKNALYFHIRTRLSALLEKYNIMIFTEFDTDKFRKTGCRADLILAQMNFDKEEEFWGDCVENYICIFELKFKGDYKTASEDIWKDYDKMKYYIEELDLGDYCHYYVATIWESYPDSKWWLPKDTLWAKGRLTELNADYNSKDEMSFYIKEH